MRRTFSLVAMAAALAAAITGSASAATLYTNAAHTTPVAVGTTLNAALASGDFLLIKNAAGSVINGCQPTYTFQVAQNSGGVFKANVLIHPMNCTVFSASSSGGVLQVSGSSTTVGTSKSWASTTITGATFSAAGCPCAENFTSGVSARQPTAGSSPVSLVLSNASQITVAPSTFWTETGTYSIAGSYSLA
jgi:hypothetical protein